MPRIKKYRIPDPIYHSCLYLVISDHKDFEDYIQKLDKEYIPIENHIPTMKLTSVHYKSKDGNIFTDSYLWMPKWEFCRDDLSSLVHEVSHFSIRIILSRGIDVTIDNNEPYCYYVEYIFHAILLKLENIYLKTSKREYEDD